MGLEETLHQVFQSCLNLTQLCISFTSWILWLVFCVPKPALEIVIHDISHKPKHSNRAAVLEPGAMVAECSEEDKTRIVTGFGALKAGLFPRLALA